METVQKDKVGFKNSEGGNEGAVNKTVVVEFRPPEPYTPPKGYALLPGNAWKIGVNLDYIKGDSKKPIAIYRMDPPNPIKYDGKACTCSTCKAPVEVEHMLAKDVVVVGETKFSYAEIGCGGGRSVRIDASGCQVYVKK